MGDMKTNANRKELNEAFKQFQRLPDWPPALVRAAEDRGEPRQTWDGLAANEAVIATVDKARISQAHAE